MPTGLCSRCKNCANDRYSKHKKYTTKIRLEFLVQGVLPCGQCDEIKPLEGFYRNKTTTTGYRSICIECVKILNQKPSYKAKVSRYATSKKGRAARYRHYNTPKGKASSIKAYRTRRARKLGVNENYTKQDEFTTLQVFGDQCFRCGSTYDIEMDHFYPLIGGNALTVTNAIPLCQVCNNKKDDRDPKDFFTNAEMRKIKQRFKKAQRLKEEYDTSMSHALPLRIQLT